MKTSDSANGVHLKNPRVRRRHVTVTMATLHAQDAAEGEGGVCWRACSPNPSPKLTLRPPVCVWFSRVNKDQCACYDVGNGCVVLG